MSALGTPWVRYGLIGGLIAMACTLLANLAVIWLSPADLCRIGPVSILLFNLGAVVVLIWMAAAAGFITARAGGSASDPALAGLLVGVLAGCALVILLPLMPGTGHRFEQLVSLCPDRSSSFSFGFGSPPPAFVFGSPPPGVVIPTPPPGVFATPPPQAFNPASGPVGLIVQLVGMGVTILIGTGAATGVATVAGFVGRRERRPEATTRA